MIDGDGYRLNVGIVICNNHGQVFWAKRYGQHSWQFPQGGIDKGEKVREAMYRELHEETGLEQDTVEILSISKRWLVYHIPHVFQRHNKKFDGAMQKWYLLKLIDSDSKINLNARGHAEFDDCKCGDEKTAIKSVIKFKRDVYKSILKEFKDVLDRLIDN